MSPDILVIKFDQSLCIFLGQKSLSPLFLLCVRKNQYSEDKALQLKGLRGGVEWISREELATLALAPAV